MKQFNLEEYNRLVAEGKTPKIVTRDGRNARILCTDLKGREECILALVEINEDFERSQIYLPDGKYLKRCSDDLDLFFAPEKKEGWTIMNKCFDSCDTKEAAESMLALAANKENYIVAHIEWEE